MRLRMANVIQGLTLFNNVIQSTVKLQLHKRNNRLSNQTTYLLIITLAPSPDSTHPIQYNFTRCRCSLTSRPGHMYDSSSSTLVAYHSLISQIMLFSNEMVSGQQYVQRQIIIDTAKSRQHRSKVYTNAQVIRGMNESTCVKCAIIIIHEQLRHKVHLNRCMIVTASQITPREFDRLIRV